MPSLGQHPHRVGPQQLRPPLCHPQACVSVALARHPCQHFEVDTSLPDAVMETKRWRSRRSLDKVQGEGTSFPCSPSGPPQPAHHKSDGSEEQSGGGKPGRDGGDKGWLGSTGGFVPVGSVAHRHHLWGQLAATSQAPQDLGRLKPRCDSFWSPLSTAVLSIPFKKQYIHCLTL